MYCIDNRRLLVIYVPLIRAIPAEIRDNVRVFDYFVEIAPQTDWIDSLLI
jgi:hypothetical protein